MISEHSLLQNIPDPRALNIVVFLLMPQPVYHHKQQNNNLQQQLIHCLDRQSIQGYINKIYTTLHRRKKATRKPNLTSHWKP